MLDFLVDFFSNYGYTAVFVILVLCGLGLPVPEDITLVSGGVISGLGMTDPHIMLAVGMAGVLIGDSTMFWLGRLFGYRIQRIRMFRKILPPMRFAKIQRYFRKYGLGILFIARFLPGLRSPIFIATGMSRRVAYTVFIFMDGFAAIISVPVWNYLGYFCADNLDLLMTYVHDVQKVIWFSLGLVLVIVLVIIVKRRIHKRIAAAEAALEVAPTETAAKQSAPTESAVGSSADAGGRAPNSPT